MHAHERAVRRVARDDGEVVGAGHAVAVGAEAERRRARSARWSPPRRSPARSPGSRRATGTSAVAVPLLQVVDERLDGDDGHALALAELDQAGQAHHLAVVGDDLGDRADRGRGRRASSGRPPPRCGRRARARRRRRARSGRMWPGRMQARRRRVRVGEHAQGVGAVGGADAGAECGRRHPRDRVAVPRGSSLSTTMSGRSRRSAISFGHRRADEAGGVAHHPGDPLLAGELGGDDDVALVLAALVVGDDDGLPGAQRVERRRGCWRGSLLAPFVGLMLVGAKCGARACSMRSTCRARMSVSMLTESPTTFAAERGRGEGLGDQRDLEPAGRRSGSLTALTVSETPSTAIEPLWATSGASSAARLKRSTRHALPSVDGEQRCWCRRCGPARCARRGGRRPAAARSRLTRSPGRGVRQGAHGERLGHDIGGEPVGALVDDGEADAADRDRVAVRRVG